MRKIFKDFLFVNLLFLSGCISGLLIASLWRFDLLAFNEVYNFISDNNNLHLLRKAFIIIEVVSFFVAFTNRK